MTNGNDKLKRSLSEEFPADIRKILRISFSIYRANLRTFATILCWVLGIPVLVSLIMEQLWMRMLNNQPPVLAPQDVYAPIPLVDENQEVVFMVWIVCQAIRLILYPLAYGAIIKGAASSMEASPLLPQECLAIARTMLKSLISGFGMNLALVISAFIVISMLEFYLIIIFLVTLPSPFIAMILPCCAAGYFAMRLLFVFHAIALEGCSAIQGIKRSFALTRGRWFKSSCRYLVIVFIILIITGTLVGIGSTLSLITDKYWVIFPIAFFDLLIFLVVHPFMVVSIFVLYHDLKIRSVLNNV